MHLNILLCLFDLFYCVLDLFFICVIYWRIFFDVEITRYDLITKYILFIKKHVF